MSAPRPADIESGQLRLFIVGRSGGTHIGESLRRAGIAAGHEVSFFNLDDAFDGPPLVRAVAWRIGRRPVWLELFSARVVHACIHSRPDILITTGAGGLSRSALKTIGAAGVTSANYSTDDPWNPALAAPWHQQALAAYDLVFTARRANIEDFKLAGCADVRYLPFGYDERQAAPLPSEAPSPDDPEVLFAGGADGDRADFVRQMTRCGVSPTLVGAYWERFPGLKVRSLGMKSPSELRRLTARAKINLCLVRRANRDGHVMRSLEIAATGGCMLAEDTPEHRELFGPDGEAVVYFSSPPDAAAKAQALLPQEGERRRMAAALRDRIAGGHHTYRDRLDAMIEIALPAERRVA